MTIPEFADPFQVFKTMQGTRRLLFFDGAPQSGRTFLAAVTAIYLADCGYRTLLLPVDPRPNAAASGRDPAARWGIHRLVT
jgi:hypothetical protein